MKSTVNAISRALFNRSFGLLLIRLALGLLFFTHGLMKVEQLSVVAVMFEQFGFFPWVGFCIAWLEVVGGLALILGVATRLFAFLFGVEMLVATILVGFSHGFGIEPLIAITSFGLMFLGSGRFSVYRGDCDNCGAVVCDGNSCIVVPTK